MVHASHVIIGAYGFWLPNDPRGSWSDFVRTWELFRFGPATKVETRQSVAARPHDRQLRLEALDSDEDIRRATRYVEENPVKEGKPRQRWTFVTPYPGLAW